MQSNSSNNQVETLIMFQSKPETHQGLLFAPRIPIQRGEGFFGAIASLFRKATPFIKKAASSTGKVLKKVANSEVVSDISKGVANSALDIGSNYVADLVSGKTGDEASSAANQKLDQARVDIANMMRNPDFSKSAKKKRKRKSGKTQAPKKNDDNDEEAVLGPPQRKKARKKAVAKTSAKKKKGRKTKKEAYSLFDEEMS